MVKIVDGMVWDSEIDKWITVEEYNKHYKRNIGEIIIKD